MVPVVLKWLKSVPFGCTYWDVMYIIQNFPYRLKTYFGLRWKVCLLLELCEFKHWRFSQKKSVRHQKKYRKACIWPFSRKSFKNNVVKNWRLTLLPYPVGPLTPPDSHWSLPAPPWSYTEWFLVHANPRNCFWSVTWRRAPYNSNRAFKLFLRHQP